MTAVANASAGAMGRGSGDPGEFAFLPAVGSAPCALRLGGSTAIVDGSTLGTTPRRLGPPGIPPVLARKVLEAPVLAEGSAPSPGAVGASSDDAWASCDVGPSPTSCMLSSWLPLLPDTRDSVKGSLPPGRLVASGTPPTCATGTPSRRPSVCWPPSAPTGRRPPSSKSVSGDGARLPRGPRLEAKEGALVVGGLAGPT